MAAQNFVRAATILCCFAAVLSATVSCPVYFYYDHGTENCEFCCDLCCQAKHKGTTKDCEQLCSEYAQKLKDEPAEKIHEDVQELGSGQGQDETAESQWTQFPVAAQAGIIAGIIAVCLVAFGLIIAKRKAIVAKFRRRGPNPELQDVEIPLQQQPQDTGTAVVEEGVAETSLVHAGTAGIPESCSSLSGGESNSWPLGQPELELSTRGSARPYTMPAKTPVQVSIEGRQGKDCLALDSTSAARMGQLRNTPLRDAEDFHSTSLKTFEFNPPPSFASGTNRRGGTMPHSQI